MVLGDVGPFWEWVHRDNPRVSELTLVWQWIRRAGDAPWMPPSVEDDHLSDKPEYQVRSAVVPETMVEVLYRETYATGVVDILAVMEAMNT